MADDDSGFDGDERMDDARSEDGAAADVGEDGVDADGGAASAPVAPVGPDPLQLSVIQDPKLRFILELEFVEMLASPHYLQCTSLLQQQQASTRDADASWRCIVV